MTKSFLPDSCLRKYPEFEDLLCLGCAPLESKYVVGDNKDTLRLCKKFALALWNATTEEELNQSNNSPFDELKNKFNQGKE